MLKLSNIIKKLSNISKINYIIILILLILCISFVAPSLARFKNRATIYEATVWDGTVANSYREGSGTKEDPFVISNGSELAFFSEMLKNTDYQDTYFTLGNDIMINDGLFNYDKSSGIEYYLDENNYFVKEYTTNYYDTVNKDNNSVGQINKLEPFNNFKGVFDGNYHTIYGAYLTTNSDNLALFTNLEGTVSNLYVDNAIIYGGNVTGGIVSNAKDTSISNVIFDGFVIGDSNNLNKNITNSISDKNFSVTSDSKEENIPLDLPVIEGKIVSKKLTGTAIIDGSGIIKINGVEVNGDFEINLNDLNSINISYSSDQIASFNLKNLTYNIDSVLSTSAGIVAIGDNVSLTNVVNKGYVYGNSISSGLIGESTDASVVNSYNSGIIDSTSVVGGIIASARQSNGITINKSYNSGQLNSQINGGIISVIDSNDSNINIKNSFNSSTGYTIYAINSSNVSLNNVLYVDLSINSGEISEGTLEKTSLLTIKDKNFLTSNLGFYEYVSNENLLNNKDSVWIYEDEMPILYIDDVSNPIANIHLSNYTWNNFSSDLTPIKFKNQLAFSIEQTDELRPIKEIYYYIYNNNIPLSKEDMESLNWVKYNDIVEISNEGIYIIYAKIIDTNDNITYINTDLILYDKTGADATISILEKNYNDFRENIDNIYINEESIFTISATDNISGISSIKYYISSELLTKSNLDDLEDSKWLDYTEGAKISTEGKNIIYAKIVDNCGYITYVNSDYINYNGYKIESLKAGQETELNIVNITSKSSITIRAKFSDDIDYKENYTHNLISNVLLPVNTSITLIDNKKKKVYKYKIATSEDIFNYSNSCSSLDCEKYATYSFSLFNEVGKKEKTNFIEDYSGKVDEDFTIIVDFSEDNITSNYENVKLSLELEDGNNTIISTIKNTIKSFNVYTNSDASLYINSNYNSSIEYNSKSTNNIDFNIGVLEKNINNNKIIDTTYENKSLGILIKFVNSEGNIVDKDYLKSMKFSIDGVSYTPESDGIIRINLSDEILATNKTLVVTTSENNLKLPSGSYYLKLSSYISYNGAYPEIYSSEINIPVNVKSTFIDENYKFKVEMNNIIKSFDRQIKIDTMYDGNFLKPNIRISLYEKVAPTAYNQEYKLIDLNNYISNNLLKFSNNVYYLDQSTNNINSFLLNIKDFSEGGYAFVFELYDDNIKVGTIEKKFIVKK